jgi:sporulation protein YlmC with PRC-barrel domain
LATVIGMAAFGLETEERPMSVDDRLVKSAALIGTKVNDADGHRLGVIREIFIDRDAGIGRYVAIDPAGLFIAAGKYRPMPWRLLTWDDKTQAYVADIAKDRFKEAPAYDRDQLGSATYGWAEQVERYFE